MLGRNNKTQNQNYYIQKFLQKKKKAGNRADNMKLK